MAYMALPSALPGHRQAVLCAVTAEKVLQQYKRALIESRVRCSGITPSSMLLFNLFHRHLTGPRGTPVLLLAVTEAASTTIMTIDGCPIFWRTHPLACGEEGDPPGSDRRGEVLRDAADAIRYSEDGLGVDAPVRLFVAGLLAKEPGLADWLAKQLGLPVAVLDAGRLVRQAPPGG